MLHKKNMTELYKHGVKIAYELGWFGNNFAGLDKLETLTAMRLLNALARYFCEEIFKQSRKLHRYPETRPLTFVLTCSFTKQTVANFFRNHRHLGKVNEKQGTAIAIAAGKTVIDCVGGKFSYLATESVLSFTVSTRRKLCYEVEI